MNEHECLQECKNRMVLWKEYDVLIIWCCYLGDLRQFTKF